LWTFGLLFSLPLVVWGSGVLSKMMNRFPIVIWVGGGVLGWVAMKMIADDPIVATWLGRWLWAAHEVAPYVLAGVITLYGWWCARGTRAKMGKRSPHHEFAPARTFARLRSAARPAAVRRSAQAARARRGSLPHAR